MERFSRNSRPFECPSEFGKRLRDLCKKAERFLFITNISWLFSILKIHQNLTYKDFFSSLKWTILSKEWKRMVMYQTRILKRLIGSHECLGRMLVKCLAILVNNIHILSPTSLSLINTWKSSMKMLSGRLCDHPSSWPDYELKNRNSSFHPQLSI